jgi:hypothetical protein
MHFWPRPATVSDLIISVCGPQGNDAGSASRGHVPPGRGLLVGTCLKPSTRHDQDGYVRSHLAHGVNRKINAPFHPLSLSLGLDDHSKAEPTALPVQAALRLAARHCGRRPQKETWCR